MTSRYKSLVKDTIIFGLGKFGSKLILFLLVPLYTRYLSTDEYGISELVFTISQIIVPIVSVMIFDGIMRFGLEKGANKNDVLAVGLFVLLFDCVISLLIIPLSSLYDSISEWRWYLYWNVILYIAYNIELNYIKACDKNKEFALLSVLQTVFIATLNVVFLVVMKLGMKGYMLATNLSYLFSFIIAFLIGKVGKGILLSHFKKKLFKSMIVYSAPLALNTLAWHIVSTTDRIMLERMLSADALGVYTLASKIPSLINVFVAIFQQSWGISSVKEFESTNDNHFYTSVFKVYYIGIFGICILLSSVMKQFMYIYVGNNAFSESWRYVPLLLVSASFSAIAVYYAGIYSALKKSINVMVTVLISGIVNLVINYFFIRIIGIYGAVVGTAMCYISIVVLRAIDVNRFISIKVNWLRFTLNAIVVVVHSIICTLDYHILLFSILFFAFFTFINFSEFRLIIQKIMHRNK